MPPHEPDKASRITRALDSVNAGYVAELYEQYQREPASVDPEWRTLFESGAGGFEPAKPAPPASVPTPPAAAAGNGSNPAPAQAPAQTQDVPEGATPIKGPAARLAQNMVASLGVPTATSFRDVDVALLEARRRELNGQIAPKKASFTHVIGWAIVQAAAEQRSMSHAYIERNGQAYRLQPAKINLGLAVDVERPDGSRFLVVPVIKGADDMDFAQFHERYEDVVARARTNKLAPDDYSGATITLTNPGTLGTTQSVPRLMPNQGTIVATGTIRGIADQRLMTISSTYDHRIIQGAESGMFLRSIDALLNGEDGFYEDLFVAMGAKAGAAPAAKAPEAKAPSVQTEAPPQAASVQSGDMKLVAGAMQLVDAYRIYGHLGAQLDPLGSPPRGDPALKPETHGLDTQSMTRIPADVLNVHVDGATLADVLPRLQEIYSGTIAYEVEHLANHEERAWLRKVIESGQHRQPLDADAQRALLTRLTAVETLERFLHKAYLGQKRFSIEGLDSMVPMLDLILEMAAADGAHRAVIGMAHRGRLNVLAHIVGMEYERILAEFEAGRADASETVAHGGMDDVKYHLGADGTYATKHGEVRVTLSPNPSHLEAVNPVVEGRARALQTDRTGPLAKINTRTVLPVLIHGDASFAAQGVVAETFNLARLPGYANGGTVHLIANNQVGFTTGAGEARSTTYSSDLAKGFDLPIVHVNADDPEACLAAARLAMLYRQRFDADMVIDLVGYRRYGHNEGDEPSYTQPQMYEAIHSHASVREVYLASLVAAGVVEEAAAADEVKRANRDLSKRQTALRKGRETAEVADRGHESLPREESAEPVTAVAAEVLHNLNEQLYRWPDDFTINPKLEKQLARRRDALDGEPKIEWAHAESLAWASLLTGEGVPIRLTGQDTLRGTFSQRHQVLFDVHTGAGYAPIAHLDGAKASVELHNSPLSEYACMGFEYGYAVQAPEALVLWEAQYGDFANGAEIIIDQFLIAGLAKWRQTSRLTLLLPHGYEGSGPEHSSARLERFLALGAEGNIRVVYPTTPAQYFHLLRRQALHSDLRPLVVMTPKSLLRLPAAHASLSELTDGAFRSVLDDPRFATDDAAAADVRRTIVCSGKVYYDIVSAEAYAAASHVAVVRLERLYPFPTDELQAVLARYPGIEKLTWVQEEPRNMGARKFVLPKIRHLVPYKIPLGDYSRPERSRPAEGYPGAHAVEQARIVREALGA
ncbi:MAG: multifunctional oxoglutarate decarboxylase/oxoglutarate dehydrogenase thiamine pyrophosphate-binding subunit/dihydrolipoyllysine-residue succinyltransferase subunit [Chloroflexota bacterium]